MMRDQATMSHDGGRFQGAAKPKAFWVGCGVVLLWGVVSRLMLNAHSYFDAEDVLRYATIVRERDFANFDAAGSGWQLICAAIDALFAPLGEATEAGKFLSRIAGTLILPILYATLALTTGRVALSLALTMLYSASFGPWWYSLQPDKYVPQSFVIAIALFLIVTRKQLPGWGFLVGMGLVYAAAILMHSASGLICLSIVPVLMQTMRRRGALSAMLQAGLVGMVMCSTLVVYFSLYIDAFVNSQSTGESVAWLMSYTATPSESRGWGHFSLASLLLVCVGLARTVISTEFAFAIPQVYDYFHNVFPAKILLEEQWFARQFSSTAVYSGLVVLCSATVLVCTTVAVAVVGLHRFFQTADDQLKHAFYSTVCWLLPAFIFFAWWEPQNNEFWISPWYGIVIIIGLILTTSVSRFLIFLVSLSAVFLVVCNGLFGVLPRLSPESDYWQVRQGALARHAGRCDLVLEFGYLPVNYLMFMSEARIFPIEAGGETEAIILQSLRNELELNKSTKAVYVTDLVWNATSVTSPYPAAKSQIVERFSQRLPAPDEWIEMGGRRIAKYDASTLLLRIRE